MAVNILVPFLIVCFPRVCVWFCVSRSSACPWYSGTCFIHLAKCRQHFPHPQAQTCTIKGRPMKDFHELVLQQMTVAALCRGWVLGLQPRYEGVVTGDPRRVSNWEVRPRTEGASGWRPHRADPWPRKETADKPSLGSFGIPFTQNHHHSPQVKGTLVWTQRDAHEYFLNTFCSF